MFYKDIELDQVGEAIAELEDSCGRFMTKTGPLGPENFEKYQARMRRRAAQGVPDPVDMKAVRACSDSICSYCLQPGATTVDHVLPVARGGDHSLDNLVLACFTCNRSKGAQTPLEMLVKGAFRSVTKIGVRQARVRNHQK